MFPAPILADGSERKSACALEEFNWATGEASEHFQLQYYRDL